MQVEKRCLKSHLLFVSLMAGNADSFYHDLAQYLHATTGLNIRVIDSASWQERTQLINHGAVDFAAVCGAVYVEHVWRGLSVQLLAAPVMSKARYNTQPVYFSDFVVRTASRFRAFADLQGASWAYNEQASFSGFQAVQAYLAKKGFVHPYFGHTIETGSHQQSLEAVIAGRADVTAIDSIVLERAVQLQPELAKHIRTVHTIGPSPVPPLVTTRHLAPDVVAALQHALQTMHTDSVGRHVLEQFQISHFVSVADRDYDHIRNQIAASRRVKTGALA